MGKPKWSLPFGAGNVLGATLGALASGGVERIVLVIPPAGDLALVAWARRQAVVTATNPDPSRGMLSSVLAGLEALGGAGPWGASGNALLVCPGDLPGLAPDTVTKVLGTVVEGQGRLVVPCWRGRRGHPLAIAPQKVPEIPGLDPAVGLRQLLDRHPGAVLELPVDDPGCVCDVNTPQEYERLRAGD